MRNTALAFLAALSCFAQAPAPTGDKSGKEVPISKAERKNRAPVSKEVLHVKLPVPYETKLDNGLTILILENHKLPNVSVSFRIEGAGALGEPVGTPGLAQVTASMLREGTRTRSSREFAEQIDRLGASTGASAMFGSPAATVSGSGLSDNVDQWLALTADMLLHPAFDSSELKKLKEREIAALRQQRSSPSFLANERFSKAVFGDFPAGEVSTTPAALESMTPEMLAQWHRDRYVPQNTILGIAGDVTPSQIVPKLKALLGEWKRTDFAEKLPPNPTPVSQKHVYLVNRPSAVQTTLILGNLAIDRRSPDYIPMTVMNRILGGGPAARLFLKLREEKGYTYGAYSTFHATEYPGPWMASSDVRTEVTEGALAEFFNELKRIREEKTPTAELDEAKHSLVSAFALSLERPSQLLTYAITRKVYRLPDDYWETYPAKIAAVTDDDVARVARKYLNLENVQVVAVGDASKIKSILEKYGPVTVYDTEGKVVSN